MTRRGRLPWGCAPGSLFLVRRRSYPADPSLLTRIRSGRLSDMLCPVQRHVAPLSGMGVMYLLMSAFHLAPWLNLICRDKALLADR